MENVLQIDPSLPIVKSNPNEYLSDPNSLVHTNSVREISVGVLLDI